MRECGLCVSQSLRLLTSSLVCAAIIWAASQDLAMVPRLHGSGRTSYSPVLSQVKHFQTAGSLQMRRSKLATTPLPRAPVADAQTPGRLGRTKSEVEFRVSNKGARRVHAPEGCMRPKTAGCTVRLQPQQPHSPKNVPAASPAHATQQDRRKACTLPAPSQPPAGDAQV